MKTYIFALALSGLSIAAVSAQDVAKNRNDGTYSTHNYKHPNKAAVARKWASQKGTEINAPGLDNRAVANYKQPVPNAEPVDGFVVPHNAQENLANRNYKFQRPNASTAVDQASEVATNPRQSLPKEN
ncbi:hypothetical protein GCM10027347_07280 [Larkinella harenae]